uniref:Uncharacterized protein n=1 Tax=Arundo donax TaxID=35708 RepID=A0A0A8XQW6_ARUDO
MKCHAGVGKKRVMAEYWAIGTKTKK